MPKLKDRLAFLTEKFDLTQEELSLRTGISQSQISRYLNDKGDISGEHLLRLSTFFGVSTDYLLGKSDDDPADDLAPKERLALNAWRSGHRLDAVKTIINDE